MPDWISYALIALGLIASVVILFIYWSGQHSQIGHWSPAPTPAPRPYHQSPRPLPPTRGVLPSKEDDVDAVASPGQAESSEEPTATKPHIKPCPLGYICKLDGTRSGWGETHQQALQHWLFLNGYVSEDPHYMGDLLS